MARVYKKVKDFPEELNQLIEILNLVPHNSEMFENSLSKLGREFVDEAFIKMEDDYEHFNHVCNVMEKYFHKLRELVPLDLAERFENQFEEADFRDAREFFGNLADQKTVLKDILFSFHFESRGTDSISFKIPPIKSFNFNEDSTLSVSGLQIIDILVNKKVALERLRECPICNNFFWAKKITSETCGKKHCIDTLGNQKRLAQAKKRKKELDLHFKSRIRHTD